MITLDSNTLLLPFDCMKKCDDHAFRDSKEEKPIFDNELNKDVKKIIKKEKRLDKKNILGLKTIKLDYVKNLILIEMSAKILKEKYFEGINKNTIEVAIDNINSSGIIELNKNIVYDHATVLKCDVTKNITCDTNLGDYIKALGLFDLNDKYAIDSYLDQNGGIIFRRKVKSYKERLVIYPKYEDMKKKKDKLNKYFQSQSQIDQIKKILRIESNLTSFKILRESFNIKSDNTLTGVSLNKILNSKENPNYKLLKRITEKNIPTLFEDYKDTEMKLYKIEKELGREKIIKDCNYNIDLIVKFIKSHVKGKISRYKKEYQALIIKMKQKEENRLSRPYRDLITELEEKLLIA